MQEPDEYSDVVDLRPGQSVAWWAEAEVTTPRGEEVAVAFRGTLTLMDVADDGKVIIAVDRTIRLLD